MLRVKLVAYRSGAVRAVVEAYVVVKVVPSKVMLDESTRKPPVVAYGTRPLVREEMEIAVVEAYGKTEATVVDRLVKL